MVPEPPGEGPAGAVAEHQRGPRAGRGLHVHASGALRGVEIEDAHACQSRIAATISSAASSWM